MLLGTYWSSVFIANLNIVQICQDNIYLLQSPQDFWQSSAIAPILHHPLLLTFSQLESDSLLLQTKQYRVYTNSYRINNSAMKDNFLYNITWYSLQIAYPFLFPRNSFSGLLPFVGISCFLLPTIDPFGWSDLPE